MSENTNGNAPVWTEGPAVEGMTTDQANSEIKQIEASADFLGNGKLTYWPRQNMLKRRDALYRHSLGKAGQEPHNSMAETLEKQGITAEGLKEMHEGFEQRDEDENRKKTMDTLITHFGGEDEAKKAIVQARGMLGRFAKPSDLAFLDESGLGNDPELIGKLAEIAEIFKRGGMK